MNLIKTYINLVKSGMFPDQIGLFMITFIALVIDTKVASIIVLFILISNYGIDAKKYVALNVLGVKAKNIIKLNYLLYFIPILLSYILVQALKGYDYNVLISDMLITLIFINVVIPTITQKEMQEPSCLKIMFLVLMILVVMTFEFFLSSNSLIAIIIEVILFVLSLAMSMKTSFDKCLGIKQCNN